jgi:hypothetical protein
VAERLALGGEHGAHAGDLRRRPGGGLHALAQHQHVDVAPDLLGGGDGFQRGVADGLAVVVGDDEHGHGQSTPASFFSRTTRSATVSTLIPPPRLGGSLTFSTVSRGATSTPKSAGVFWSMGFFLAFMMLGSEA